MIIKTAFTVCLLAAFSGALAAALAMALRPSHDSQNAVAALQARQYESCLQLALKAERADPASRELPMLAGLCAMRSLEIETAYEQLSLARARNPGDGDVLQDLIIVTVATVRVHEAWTLLAEFERRFPDHPRYESLRGIVLTVQYARDHSGLSDDALRQTIMNYFKTNVWDPPDNWRHPTAAPGVASLRREN